MPRAELGLAQEVVLGADGAPDEAKARLPSVLSNLTARCDVGPCAGGVARPGLCMDRDMRLNAS